MQLPTQERQEESEYLSTHRSDHRVQVHHRTSVVVVLHAMSTAVGRAQQVALDQHVGQAVQEVLQAQVLPSQVVSARQVSSS